MSLNYPDVTVCSTQTLLSFTKFKIFWHVHWTHTKILGRW